MAAALDLPVDPGMVTAFLFVVLDIFTVGILDIILSRVVCLVYYRNITDGKPVPVTSADIPGISNYLLGSRLAPVNVLALVIKFALLGVVLMANVSIKSRTTSQSFRVRNATFVMNSTEAFARNTSFHMVRRRPEDARACVVEDGDSLAYYPLRFSLRGEEVLEGTDVTGEADMAKTYDVDDATMACMSPVQVSNPDEPVAVVEGCTHKMNGSCLTNVIQFVQHGLDDLFVEGEAYEPYDAVIQFKFRETNMSTVQRLWAHYSDPRLTCLSTEIGITGNSSTTYVHCLLVSHERNATTNATSTIVERWKVWTEAIRMTLPGVRFQGKVPFGRLACARYLARPFPFSDYRTLSGELVAQAAYYKHDPLNVGRLKSEGKTVTTVEWYAVGLVGVSMGVVVMTYVAIVVMLRGDRRPYFNIVNGLSSILREENEPSGRSYDAGRAARLGFTYQSDRLHFGPLRSKDHSIPYHNGYDIS